VPDSMKVLKVKMLGSFSLNYNGKDIVLDRNTVSKTTQLLQIILSYVRDGISKTGLIEILYGREEVENGNGSLNNTIFRLRKQLKAAGLPDSNYIKIKSGICRWDEDIPVQIDCCRFEDLVKKGDQEENENNRMEDYLQACNLYTGEFLPNMIGENWVAVKNIFYRNMYFSCLGKVFRWLKDQGRFEDIYQMSKVAADIYPFENWQIWMIDSLIAMSRYKEAMKVYEETTKLLFDELNLPPSQELLDRFHIMGEKMQQPIEAIEDINHRLREKEMTEGAYYCKYPSFVDAYHIVSRTMERSGISVYIMLCTLNNRNNRMYGEKEKDKEISEILQESIRKALRKGDFYTKYNSSQYIIMLSGINQQNCSKVSSRINAVFRKMVKRTDYKVDYYIASVEDFFI
jgi:DNA-binding SARP family transcriptional activator